MMIRNNWQGPQNGGVFGQQLFPNMALGGQGGSGGNPAVARGYSGPKPLIGPNGQAYVSPSAKDMIGMAPGYSGPKPTTFPNGRPYVNPRTKDTLHSGYQTPQSPLALMDLWRRSQFRRGMPSMNGMQSHTATPNYQNAYMNYQQGFANPYQFMFGGW